MIHQYQTGLDSVLIVMEIDRRLRASPKPSLEVLIRHICKKRKKRLAKRTVQWYIEQMRYNERIALYAPIVYNKAINAYHYSDPDYKIANKLV